MNRLSIFALATCALFVIAVFAPWVTLGGLISASLTQSGDAPYLVGAAALTALAYWRAPLRLFTPLLSLLTATFMAAEVAVVIDKLSNKAKTGNEIADAFVGAAAPSWGLYLGAITALALYGVSIALLTQRRSMMAEPVAA